jgi:riboflavin kinase/FMN adenylyltransferase
LEISKFKPGHVYEPTVVALGNFDGVHLGHRKLLEWALEKSRSENLKLSVLLFCPHPLKVLYPERKLNLLTSYEERLEIFEQIGVDKVLLFPFTSEFATTSPEAFVREVLLKIGTVHVFVGFDYTFGYQGKGNPEVLKVLAKQYGFGLSVLEAQKVNNKLISSSEIRKHLLNGDISQAKELMGSSPKIVGKVIPGDKRGRSLGFPTANIQVGEDSLIPKNGVYAVKTIIDGQEYKGMLNIGLCSTFKDLPERSIEVNFFDYQGNLYDRKLSISLEARLRDEKKFKGVEEIISQLYKDKQKALTLLNSMK